MINWDRIAELQAEVGEDGIEEVIEIFIDEVRETVGELKAPEHGVALGDKLHFLKGSAQNIGLEELSSICAREESALRNNPAHCIPVDQIADALGRATAELEAFADQIRNCARSSSEVISR